MSIFSFFFLSTWNVITSGSEETWSISGAFIHEYQEVSAASLSSRYPGLAGSSWRAAGDGRWPGAVWDAGIVCSRNSSRHQPGWNVGAEVPGNDSVRISDRCGISVAYCVLLQRDGIKIFSYNFIYVLAGPLIIP